AAACCSDARRDRCWPSPSRAGTKRSPRPTRTRETPSAGGATRTGSSWREREPVPVRAQLPLARGERVDLERLRELVDVEPLANGRFIPDPLRHVVRVDDRARPDVADETLHVAERFERLPER